MLHCEIASVRDQSQSGQEATRSAVQTEMTTFGSQLSYRGWASSRARWEWSSGGDRGGEPEAPPGRHGAPCRIAQKTMGQRLEEVPPRAVTEVHGQLGASRREPRAGWSRWAGTSPDSSRSSGRRRSAEASARLLLERLLAEILPADAYRLQHTFRSGDKVDAAIVLAGRRLVPVDSGVSARELPADDRGADEERRPQARRAFSSDVRNRVDEIARKYIVRQTRTPSTSRSCDIPAENVYYELILRDEAGEDARSATRSRAAWCRCRPTPSTRTSR